MSLRFRSLPARDAYAAAGSFVRFVRESRGASAVRALYRAGSLAPLGDDVAALEREWHAFLDRESIDVERLELGRARFRQVSVFHRPCPHAIAQLRADLARDAAAGNLHRALRTCRAILDVDPADLGTRAVLVDALARSGDVARARGGRDALDHDGAPEPFVAKADEALADGAWRAGRLEEAAGLYRRALEMTIGDDARRVLEVKSLGIEAGGVTAALIRSLLVPEPGRASTPALGIHVGHELDRLREDGLGAYLVGRNLVADGRFDLALTPLAVSLERGLPTEMLRLEALRLRVTALVAGRRYDEADAVVAELASIDATAFEASEWRARIAFLRSR
jgi:tetratricopeptide (TPR) repeat protein